MEDYTDHADQIHSFSRLASEVLMRRAIKTTAGNSREEESMHRELERMDFDDLIEWGAEIVEKKKEEDNSWSDGLDEEEYNTSDDDQMGYYNGETLVCDDNSDDDQMDYSEKLVFDNSSDEDQTDEEMVDMNDDDATVAAPAPATVDSKFWISVGLGFGVGFGLGFLLCC